MSQVILRYGCENLGNQQRRGEFFNKNKHISATKNKNAIKRKIYAKFLLKNPRFSQYRT